jgi:hypothetical protein
MTARQFSYHLIPAVHMYAMCNSDLRELEAEIQGLLSGLFFFTLLDINTSNSICTDKLHFHSRSSTSGIRKAAAELGKIGQPNAWQTFGLRTLRAVRAKPCELGGAVASTAGVSPSDSYTNSAQPCSFIYATTPM